MPELEDEDGPNSDKYSDTDYVAMVEEAEFVPSAEAPSAAVEASALAAEAGSSEA